VTADSSKRRKPPHPIERLARGKKKRDQKNDVLKLEEIGLNLRWLIDEEKKKTSRFPLPIRYFGMPVPA
jgi:hypothetical protein